MKNLKIIFTLLLILFDVHANDSLEKVKLQLQWKHQFEFAGFYAAKEKDFYKDEGLDVELIEFDNDVNIIQSVLDGKNDYGITYSNLISEYLEGKPLIFIANFLKQSPLALVTQKDITSPAELKDKKIMGVSDQINSSMFLLIFKRFGIKTDDFISVAPTFNIDDFIDGKVDAMTVFTTNEPYFLDEINYKYNLINPTIFGAEFYDLNLFTSKNELINNPSRVEKIKRATIRGWEYALKHKEEIINIILKKYNSQHKTKEALMYEANKIESLMLPSVYSIGSIDKGRIKLIIDNFISLNLINEYKNVDINDFVYERTSLPITAEEEQYLNSKKNIKICIHPKWYPFEALNENQEHVGLSKDYLDLFSKFIKKDFKIVSTGSWQESLEFLEDKNCDILPIAPETFMDKANLIFTKHYFSTDLVMIGRKNDDLKISNSYTKKTIGICKNFKLNEEIRNRYSNIKFIEIENYVKGFKLLSEKKIDGYINALPVMSNYLQSNYSEELKIMDKLDEKLNFSIAVRNDEKMLQEILNKAILRITNEDVKKISDKYLIPVIEKEKDNSILKIIIFIIVLFVVYLLFKQYISYKVTKILKNKIEIEIEKSKQKDNMIFHQNKLIAMGEMIENIAHQWKQPLHELNCNIILMDEELKKLKIKNNSLDEYLDNIENLTVYMSSTINDFKKFYSKEKELKKFNLLTIINNTLAILKQSFQQENILVEVNSIEPIIIENYANEFQQVILSILNNSREAFKDKDIEKKYIKIDINELKDNILISIEDNAGGIKKEIIDKIFDQHFTTKKISLGSGLGLYVSKMIIENSIKGKIEVKSIKNKSIFTIKLKK